MSILNVGARALQANQTVLQVTGNNIANVNTLGYSRQSAVLQTTEGQYTGSGYIGKGVDVSTIVRNYSDFLTRQSTLAGSISAGDTKRADQLKQLESILPGGASGLGAAVSDMLNSFADVANAPTDLTARTVALTRVNETAARLRSAAASMDDLRRGVVQELNQKVTAINSLSANIAAVNDKIARAQNSGQPPNDLMDQRDRLITQLNVFVQTSQIPATDGTVGVFLADGQPLVLGITVSDLKITADTYNDPLKSKLALTRSGQTVILEESRMGGGEVSGLLRFQNTDLTEGRNLLGRYALAVSTSMNDQHKLGLDLDGNVGGNLFTPTATGTANVLRPVAPANPNTGTASMNVAIGDLTKFAASDYEVTFTAPPPGSPAGSPTGSITRLSDGVVTTFTASPVTRNGQTQNEFTVDGWTLSVSGTANPGDRFLIKPYFNAATDIQAEFSTPRALAVASPVAGAMGTNNAGSLQLANLSARSNPPANVPVTLTFTGPNTYTRSDVQGQSFTYTSGQAIGSSQTGNPTDWSVTLQGTPKAGDSFTIRAQPAAYRNLNAGNATALMNLRDVAMFDGSALTDGYASLISQIGIRAQSANYSADVSNTIAANLEKDRTSVSGVNLDEEASKLLQYQQAYQASAKVIQIAQGIFDTLMQTFR